MVLGRFAKPLTRKGLVGSNPTVSAILRQGYGLASPMYYTYILKSSKSQTFYVGYSSDVKKRLFEHNSGLSAATKPFIPWTLSFYAAFETEKLAKDFELYLKSGSGRAFSYKRLVK